MNTVFKLKSFKKLSKDEISVILARVKKRVDSGKFLKKGTYLRYIEYLRVKTIKGSTEKHHVVPRHDGGLDIESNIIRIYFRDHTLAHLFLYLEKGHRGDLLSYSLRVAGSHINLQERSRKIAFIHQINSRLFWDTKWQSDMGKRGGTKGGSKNTEAQFQARQQVGLAYGREVGIGNQKQDLTLLLQTHTLLVIHKEKPDMVFYIGPARAGIDLAKELLEQCDVRGVPTLKFPLKDAAAGGHFYSFLRGKKSFRGWKRINAELIVEYNE